MINLIKAQDFIWPIVGFKLEEETNYSFSIDMHSDNELLECNGVMRLIPFPKIVSLEFYDFKVHRVI